MKKLICILSIAIIMLEINVFASSGVSLSLSCEDLNLARGESATCDLNVSTNSTISLDNASLQISSDSDLEITYAQGQYFYGSINSGNLVVSSDAAQSGNFKLGKLTIKVSTDATYENKALTLSNIKFSNSENTTEIYEVNNVVKNISVLSDNNNLESISIDGTKIENFKTETLNYDLKSDKETIKITAVSKDSLATITGVGDKKLAYGKNTVEIKVVSQSGSSKVYKLNITRQDNRSDVNTLKTLTIDGVKFNFKSNTLEYKINLESDIETIKIDSTLTDDKASYVKDYGNREVDLNYGENKVLIKVLSEKGNEKTYTLILNREDDRSDVAKLTSLVINDNVIELKDNVYEYNLTLLFRHNKTNIVAKSNDKATLDYKDMDLTVGDNQLVIKVISEKETEKEYKINIKRLTQEESKAVIQDIIIEGYELNFSKEITNYNLKINEDDKTLKINVLSNDLESIVSTVMGNSDLKNGSVVTINVKDDLGEYVYKINISKDVDESENLILGILTIEQVCYIVFIFGFILFICSIIYAISAKKSKKK